MFSSGLVKRFPGLALKKRFSERPKKTVMKAKHKTGHSDNSFPFLILDGFIWPLAAHVSQFIKKSN